MKEKRPLSINLAYFFGGLSIVGIITTFIAGFFFAILSIICIVIARIKHKASYKIAIPCIVGIIFNILVVIIISIIK